MASAAHADEDVVALAAHADLAMVRATTSLECARALAARADDAFTIYSRLEHVRHGNIAHAHLAMDGIP